MEKYGAEQNFSIVSISRSKSPVGVNENSIPQDEKILFSLIPCIVLNEKDKTATTILVLQFFNKDKKPISNKLEVNVGFKFRNQLPIFKDKNDGNEKVRIYNYEDLISMLDTSIGVYRGILFEWLEGSRLQKPFPLVNIENLVQRIKVSFTD